MGLFGNRREKELKELVAWCVEPSNHIRYNLSLLDYVHNAQIDLNIDKKYRIIGEEEREYAKILLKGFQEELQKDYFNNRIPLQKSRYVIRGEDFFMMYLFIYLSDGTEHSQMCSKDISVGSSLTDFGVVAYKMFYIAFKSCKASPIYSNMIAGWLKDSRFTDVIDTRTV